ncbi:MAG: hypothetical protein V7708_17465 [Oceanicoccus sp.]
MGGTGSGSWCRGSKQDTTEDCKSIDIRMMKRRGWLNPGRGGTLTWSWNGEPWGNINYRCQEGRLLLDYRFRSGGDEWEPVKQTIFITTTPCNYGNERQWFSCPRCGYRCALLYSAGRLFLCRKCYELPYASQMQSDLDRLVDQKHKLGKRIFEYYDYGDGCMKKTGMRWKTFDRLHARFARLDERINQGICYRFGDEYWGLLSA